MGLGSTAKKIQQMVDIGEELYQKLTEVREQITALRETVEETRSRLEALEQENERQRALLAALAEEEGLDADSILAAAEVGTEDGTATSGNDVADAGTVDGNP